MAVTQVNGVTINKLTLDKYRELRNSNSLVNNESYVITDIDKQLDKLIVYKESLDANNPIILRGLSDGLYKIYGYFKYNTNQSGISAADPAALISIASSSTTTYAQIIDYNGIHRYEITDSTYINADDSGWITATLASNFTNYSSGSTPEYRKIGNIIEIRGIVKPKSVLTASNTGITIFTLPNGYRPSKVVYEVCQGSGRNVWLLTINTNGTVTISRYGVTSNIDVPTSAWLCFNKTFTI